MLISKKDLEKNLKNKTFKKQFENSVFIYPTDTIYGIGCNACNDSSVKKIRKLKKRKTQPFSIIAPSKAWISKNCVIDKNVKFQLQKLPGAYTLILKLKNKKAISKYVNCGLNSVGVRILDHWFTKIVSKLGFPVVTTSVNVSKEKHMTCLGDLNKKIKNNTDLIIYEGSKKGKSSTVINCLTSELLRR